MVEIGKFNRLKIIKERSVGYFFDGGEDGDILMPKRHQPEFCEVGDELDVFIFHDAEERLTATTRIPLAQVGEVAWLEVIDTHPVGAFLDWGLTKDLLVPLREQAVEMEVGKSYLVRILLDPRERIIGSAKLENYLEETSDGSFEAGQQVSLLLAEHSELGFRAIVNHSHWGLLYDTEVFQALETGQTVPGYIKKVRDDLRLDLSLQPPGYVQSRIDGLAGQILERLKAQGGKLALSDKSPPEEIYAAFGVSKKNFKQALGLLYKERLVTLDKHSVELV